MIGSNNVLTPFRRTTSLMRLQSQGLYLLRYFYDFGRPASFVRNMKNSVRLRLAIGSWAQLTGLPGLQQRRNSQLRRRRISNTTMMVRISLRVFHLFLDQFRRLINRVFNMVGQDVIYHGWGPDQRTRLTPKNYYLDKLVTISVLLKALRVY